MRVMIIAAHADDAEVSMGGTIAKFARAGHEVRMVVGVIPCENIEGMALEEEKKRRYSECELAAKILGAELDVLDLDPYQIWFRRDLVKRLDDRIRDFSPDIIFTHWEHDSHQDHVAIANATFAATRKNTTCLLLYEQQILGGVTPYAFKGDVFVDISDVMDVKMKSIRAYRSQHAKYGTWLEAVEGLAAFRGHQIGVKYAEAFRAVKLLLSIEDSACFLSGSGKT